MIAPLAEPARAPRLRIAVLATGTTLSAWQRAVLVDLQGGGDVDIVALVIDATAAPTSPTSRFGRLARVMSSRGLWRLYNNAWVANRSVAVRRVDCADFFADSVQLRVEPEQVGRWSQHFSDGDVNDMRSLDLDVMLRFGFGILRGEVLEVARHGIWSFHHDDERVIRGGPPSFWEVMDELPTTGVLLQRLTDRLDAGVPLARATFRTIGYSYPRNRDQAALGAAPLVANVARAVRQGWMKIEQLESATSEAPIRRDPTTVEMLRFAASQTRRAVRARVNGVLVGSRWSVAVGSMPEIDQPVSLPLLEWLPERAGGYYADPFPAGRDGREAVLVEEYDERSGIGVISALCRDGERWDVLSNVLGTAGHASYPYLLDVDGDLFCIPENALAGAVRAWRCTRFPDQWVEHVVLLDEPVIDPTVFEHGGQWWLFGTLRNQDSNSALHAWSAPSWDGPYTAHPLNPIKIDVTASRPAGTPFVVGGALYRPAQDCSEGYGGAVVINRVDQLDETGFREEVVGALDVDGALYRAGNHTFSWSDGVVAVDGKRNVRDPHRSRREFMARLRKIR